jgi:hypothetical protein
VLPDAYNEADLRSAADQITTLALQKGWNVAVGVGCAKAGFWRVELTRFALQDSPELRAETEALIAPFGDKVSLSYCPCVITGGSVPTQALPPSPSTPAAPGRPLDVRDFYSKRCRRGVLRLTAKNGSKSLRLSAGKRHAAGKRVRLRLNRRFTRVKVTVIRKDGGTFAQRVPFKRC